MSILAKKHYSSSGYLVSFGFTLIELILVLAIIGILVAVSVPLIRPIELHKRSRDARRKADLELIRQALELYRADNGGYPTGGWYGSARSEWETGLGNGVLVPDYISVLPVDPINNATGRRGPCGGKTTYRYNYRSVNSGGGYILTAIMEQVDSNNGNECASLPNWGTNCRGTPATNDYCYGVQNP